MLRNHTVMLLACHADSVRVGAYGVVAVDCDSHGDVLVILTSRIEDI